MTTPARRRLHPRLLAPLGATVAVLLHRGYISLLEIPVGGPGLLGRLFARRRTAAVAAA